MTEVIECRNIAVGEKLGNPDQGVTYCTNIDACAVLKLMEKGYLNRKSMRKCELGLVDQGQLKSEPNFITEESNEY